MPPHLLPPTTLLRPPLPPDTVVAAFCSAILPVPYAFSITGAVVGVLVFAGTALANMCTCHLLLRGAVASATCDYEGLAEAIGGPIVRVRGSCTASQRALVVCVQVCAGGRAAGQTASVCFMCPLVMS